VARVAYNGRAFGPNDELLAEAPNAATVQSGNAATLLAPDDAKPPQESDDQKSRWLKNVADSNRLAGPTGAQITGIENGRLNYAGDPRTSKQGRSLMASVDEALKAGATLAEIAQAAAPKPAAPNAAAPEVEPPAQAGDRVAAAPVARLMPRYGESMTIEQAVTKARELEADSRARKAKVGKTPTAFMSDIERNSAAQSATLARRLREDIRDMVAGFPDMRAEYESLTAPAATDTAPAASEAAAPQPVNAGAPEPSQSGSVSPSGNAAATKQPEAPAPIAPTTGSTVTLDGKRYTVAKTGKASVTLEGEDGKKRTVMASAPAYGKIQAVEEVKQPEAAAPAPASAGFDSAAWDKAREDRIKASREAGNTHLDKVPAYVETMRGKRVYYVHDPKVKGTVRTVDNNGNVYVNWADAYSAEKEGASPMRDGKKTVMQTSLGPRDLKDYVLEREVAPAPAPAAAAPAPAPSQPKPETPAAPTAEASQPDRAAKPERPEALIELRKRLSVLEALRRCIG
jgi:hypothetical protein